MSLTSALLKGKTVESSLDSLFKNSVRLFFFGTFSFLERYENL